MCLIKYWKPLFASLSLSLALTAGMIAPCTILADQTSAATDTKQTASSSSNLDKDAESLKFTAKTPGGDITSTLTDDSTSTGYTLNSSTALTVNAEGNVDGIYIKWGGNPEPWVLTMADGSQITCGQNGFLHEYVKLPSQATSFTISVNEKITIDELILYSEGKLPSSVQVWEKPNDEADILVFSTHADDEILFLGGVLATYAGRDNLKVQLVYMTNYWNGLTVREHEKLDGIWECGVKQYPVNAPFDDIYATDLEGAKKVYSYDQVAAWACEQVRRFKPLVVVTQDQNGEYGHGGHMLLADTVKKAVDHSAEADYCPESVSSYGTYDVPKTYLHLYPENTISMDLRQPISNLNNRTALETAKDAYKLHVSQQWCWFYVSDEYEYSCANFGLYRSLVGQDTGNDMLEHLTSYEEQAKIAAQKEEESKAIASSQAQAEQKKLASSAASPESDKKGSKAVLIIAIIAILIILVLSLLMYKARLEKERRRRHRTKLKRKKRQ